MQPVCPLCDSRSELIYKDNKDYYFSIEGVWDIYKCINNECGHAFIYPIPGPGAISSFYSSYHTHDNEKAKKKSNLLKNEIFNYLNFRFVFNKMVEALMYIHPGRREDSVLLNFNLSPTELMDSSILEFGCGSGENLIRLKKQGARVFGVDFDVNAILVAKKKGLNVIKINKIEDVDFSEKFDLIILCHVIEHLPDPISVLLYLKNMLKPNGKFHILTPNINSFGHKIYKEHWRGLETPRHLNIFSVESLVCASRKSGLKVERIETTSRGAGILLESHIKRYGNKFSFGGVFFINRIVIESAIYFCWLINKIYKNRGEEIYCKLKSDKEI